MSHRGEGSVYYEKTPPDKPMSSPSDSDTPRGTARRASDPQEGLEERRPALTPPEMAHLAEGAKHDLTDTVGARTIIIHGPTGTGKSTVVPWEAMRWLEDYCADRATNPGIVLCSQQRRKVTISLAEEVRKRHGEVGHAVVGFHVSRNRNAGPATRLMYVTEAIGVYALINNRDLKPSQPVTIVVADEVHERTMYTQMIIGLARTQMKENPTMILILMSATVDVAELKLAIPGAQDIEIDQHEYKVSRFFLVLQWLMPIPVEWLIERDWWIQTHWEDGDSREVYRQLLRSPILRDMVSTTRLQPGARAMVVHIDQVPEPEVHKPKSANVHTVALAHHRFLIPSQELEIVYDVMSADYLLDMSHVSECLF